MTLSFAGARGASVELAIFDAGGRRILARRFEGRQEALWSWDGRDAGGRRLPAGVFLARLSSGDAAISRRLLLLH